MLGFESTNRSEGARSYPLRYLVNFGEKLQIFQLLVKLVVLIMYLEDGVLFSAQCAAGKSRRSRPSHRGPSSERFHAISRYKSEFSAKKYTNALLSTLISIFISRPAGKSVYRHER